jgi:hypothetical protein
MAAKTNKKNALTREQKIAQTTAANKAAILEAHQTHGLNVTRVCDAVGIGRTVYYTYRNDDPEFDAACEEVCETISDEAEQTLMDLMRHSNDKVRHDSAKTILTARAKKRGYGTERRETEHSGSLDINAKVEKVRFELPDNGTADNNPKPPPRPTTASGG